MPLGHRLLAIQLTEEGQLSTLTQSLILSYLALRVRFGLILTLIWEIHFNPTMAPCPSCKVNMMAAA